VKTNCIKNVHKTRCCTVNTAGIETVGTQIAGLYCEHSRYKDCAYTKFWDLTRACNGIVYSKKRCGTLNTEGKNAVFTQIAVLYPEHSSYKECVYSNSRLIL
jgi:hypothetical protein